jgi:predicted ribosomally synthesized peptide with SipW-like signal peptide
MKRGNLVLAMVAVVLVLGMSVGNAWSYFTDTTTAEGSIPISTTPTTIITEENGPGTKTIRIRNTSDMAPVWVRARVYAASVLGADASGTNWSGEISDWYEYSEPLPAGDETEPLGVTFALLRGFDETDNPTGAHDGDEYNIVVVYESIPVCYDASGKTLPANWND